MTYKINNAEDSGYADRAWKISVEDDFGTYYTIDIDDHMVTDKINEYIRELDQLNEDK